MLFIQDLLAIETHGLTLPLYAAYCQYKVNIASQNLNAAVKSQDINKIIERRALLENFKDEHSKVLAKTAAPGDFPALESTDSAAHLQWLLSKVKEHLSHLHNCLATGLDDKEVANKINQAKTIQQELTKAKELFQKSNCQRDITPAAALDAQSTKLLVKNPIINARQSSGTSFIVDGTYVHAGTSLEVKVKLKEREKFDEVQHEYKIMFKLYHKNKKFFIISQYHKRQ